MCTNCFFPLFQLNSNFDRLSSLNSSSSSSNREASSTTTTGGGGEGGGDWIDIESEEEEEDLEARPPERNVSFRR